MFLAPFKYVRVRMREALLAGVADAFEILCGGLGETESAEMHKAAKSVLGRLEHLGRIFAHQHATGANGEALEEGSGGVHVAAGRPRKDSS